jgi:predicted N-acetyltransferase YhbS
MITLRQEKPSDIPAREALLDEAFGAAKRRRKTSERLRRARLPAEGLSLVAADGDRIVGTARLWDVVCESGQTALLLGPVAVAADRRGAGIGAALVRKAVAAARKRGHSAIVLVGDAPYYGRFGFTPEKAAALRMPGPFERRRLLALELRPGTLDGAAGLIVAAGRMSDAAERRSAARAA